MYSKKTLVIGLTGNIACGKSLAAKYFKKNKIAVLDADQIAHRLIQKPGEFAGACTAGMRAGGASDNARCVGDKVGRKSDTIQGLAYKKVIQAFGKEILDSEKNIVRSKLGKIVFKDPKKRKILEGILHPLIQKSSKKIIQKYQAQGHFLVVYEASLLIEAGSYKNFDGILLITSNRKLQLKRLLERSPALSKTQALRVLSAQMPQKEKRQYATWEIDNNSSLKKFQAKLVKWLKQF